MKPFLQLKSVEEVLKLIFSLPMLASEKAPLDEALGRYLAEPFHAPENLPGFRRSTMDGFAIHASDVFGATEGNPALLNLAASCVVGQMPSFLLNIGEASPIVTGAPLPPGADAVVMVEHSRPVGEQLVELTHPVGPGANIVEADDDAASGQLLIPAGKKIGPAETGMLAAFGKTEILVRRKPKVAIISSGEEIVDMTEAPGPGQVRDVNSWSLQAICAKHGASSRRLGIVPDNQAALSETLANAAKTADVIVISGGSSAGRRDYTLAALESIPDSRILAHGVAISPGKPFILAASPARVFLGMPGHVSSCLVCAHVFLVPLIEHLQGLQEPAPKPWVDATLARPLASMQGRRDYIRCRLEKRDGQFFAWPLLLPSAALRSLIEADGFVICPENSEGLQKGEKVRVYPF